ncbi:methyl-accepting chemotaxis protein [Colwellia psychrerythraea]|uniref:Methyl-accepting chemotaxis sensory transducer with Cache sensor n=1 Tax=Colwellia psychrerythraea TaxID=28229 RepID=A0A099KZ12_COLPS|nr:methyl-accepting chemotaxis protein [Colwellia psychrerythraea]KGJ95057.1 methyl-accepting chemotaxis sensory transducer with Cache sensor [Colwellia psychrerythraea]
MSWIQNSITKQLVIMIGGALLIVMTIASIFKVIETKEKTYTSFYEQLGQLTQQNADKVTSFFESKAKIVQTYALSPTLTAFLNEHSKRGQDESRNPNYINLVKFNNDIIKSDDSIRSIFIGSAKTYEYIDETGIDTSDYTIKGKVWWNAVLATNKLFVGNPTMLSLENPTMVSSIMKPIYDSKNQLLAAVGIDIEVDTIAKDLLAKVKFKGLGEAFLITDSGNIVYFPNFTSDTPSSANIAIIDQKFSATDGFSQLHNTMSLKSNGITNVNWQGEEQQVFWQQITSEKPYLKWHVAFMLPTKVADSVVQGAVIKEIVTAIVLIIIICSIVTLLSIRFRNQINELVCAMQDVADGDGDLSRRIQVTRSDELATLGHTFNRFADQIHKLVTLSKAITDSVTQKSGTAFQTWHETRSFMNQQKGEVEISSAATTEMAQTSTEMANSANQVATYAEDANKQMLEAKKAVINSQNNMIKLGHQIQETSNVVEELRQNSDEISGVLDVIRSVAEQTNLLALNAAIEAARAGEQGRGFAVVADEVRTLASKTQESTTNIQEIIQKLQSSSVAAEQAIAVSCTSVEENNKASNSLVEKLNHATDAVGQIQHQVLEISEAVNQQATVAEDIAENVSKVRDLSDDAINCGNELEVGFESMSASAAELAESLNKFKV